jgi:hypothetical protein
MHRPPDPIYFTSRADVGQEHAAAACADAAPSGCRRQQVPMLKTACTTTSHAHAPVGNQPCTIAWTWSYRNAIDDFSGRLRTTSMTHAAPNRLHHLRTRARALPRQAIYIDHDIKICTASNQTTSTLNIKIKLYDYINYVKIIVEFYIANKNIAKVYINVVFCRRRHKKNPPPP